MLHRLRPQLGLVFVAFLALVGGSVAATFAAIRGQASDAVVINLAGRQRMLTQRMLWLALLQPDSPELDASIHLFEDTLAVLRDGGLAVDPRGQAVRLPPTAEADLRSHLDAVAQRWAGFRAHLRPLDVAALQSESTLILAELDTAVGAFEAHAEAKLARLQVIQAAFLVTALLLLAWSYRLTRRRIVEPVAALGAAARRMAGGHLAEPVVVTGGGELGELGQALEDMRTELAAARDQLGTRVTQRTSELATVFELSQEIVAQLDLECVLRSVAGRVRALVEAQSTCLCLLAADGQQLELAAGSGAALAYIGQRQPAGKGLPSRVIGAGQAAVVEAACSVCRFFDTAAAGQCAAAPLRVGEHTLGALCAVRAKNGQPFNRDESRALTLLANSAAIAIANARLVEAGRQQARQTAILAERERLAAELHDHLAQTLAALGLKIERVRQACTPAEAGAAAAELEAMEAAVARAYRQVRAALVDLQEPPGRAEPAAESDAEALARAVEACVAEFRNATGLAVDLRLPDPAALRLPRLAQVQAVHVVREALANVRRHAQARQAWVTVERANGEVRFAVEDDGRGFDLEAVESDKHLGLAIIRARAERSGGCLSIASTPGSGTRVTAVFPVEEAAP
ncbi:MAG: type IV pili methyl-accepting chemotaxis transducer N-terminal domain-containing protein [Anaerolineales bacterium]|nr:type IV pili methyl-accepting chemotaxis transducer N-terminal domain-containing protein [Anaerolineales bacterium]